MEEERTHREIELRSEEVQEVMGKIPPAILRYGIVVLLGIMAVVLAGSACFSYPDTVETEKALEIMVNAYDTLKMPTLARHAREVLAKNYPDNRLGRG